VREGGGCKLGVYLCAETDKDCALPGSGERVGERLFGPNVVYHANDLKFSFQLNTKNHIPEITGMWRNTYSFLALIQSLPSARLVVTFP